MIRKCQQLHRNVENKYLALLKCSFADNTFTHQKINTKPHKNNKKNKTTTTNHKPPPKQQQQPTQTTNKIKQKNTHTKQQKTNTQPG